MSSKVIFLTSSHGDLDDRIFYHFAASLKKNNYVVQITSSLQFKDEQREGIILKGFNGIGISGKRKINEFHTQLKNFNPDIIICTDPITILSAVRYKKSIHRKIPIIYDVTEWYFIRKQQGSFLKKLAQYIKLLIFNLIAAGGAKAFIFGEKYKSIIFRVCFPFRTFCFISYYPDLSNIKYSHGFLKENEISLCYTGNLSKDKGLDNFVNVVKYLNRIEPGLLIRVKLIGWFESEEERFRYTTIFNEMGTQLKINYIPKVDYNYFSDQLIDADILFDLRDLNFINIHALPIKIFYYAACGRPVIYFRSKAILHDVDFNQFGYLVDPKEFKTITDIIRNYIQNPDLYSEHCLNARRLAETNYNWGRIEGSFIRFIESQIEVKNP